MIDFIHTYGTIVNYANKAWLVWGVKDKAINGIFSMDKTCN